MSRKDDPKVTEIIISVMGQAAVCDIVDTEQHRQANVYLPQNGGAALFAMFDLDTDDETIRQALIPVLRGEPLEEDKEITEQVEGSVFAGTIQRPVLKVNQVPATA